MAKLYFFGSVLTDEFDPATSDLDVLVEIDSNDPIEKGELLMSLWSGLELLFQRRVDLLTKDSINNPYLKKSIDRSKKMIYDRQREEILV